MVVADIQDNLGCSVCESLGPENATYVHCDATNEPHMENAVAMSVSAYEARQSCSTMRGSRTTPRLTFERVLSINATGVFLGTKHAAGVMIPAWCRSIINTSSIGTSYIGGVTLHTYTNSKNAVVGLMKNTVVELGQFGIWVNCLSPFACATPLATRFLNLEAEKLEQEMNQLANLKGTTFQKIDIANAALFLPSDEGRYISGHNMLIDGGFSIAKPLFGTFKYPDV